MALLGVNIDHVATVREARKTNEPDPVWAASLAELGGADGITLHLREDRRHIQERDLHLLRQTVTVKLNLELACDDDVLRIACEAKPFQATLVPERREEITTEGGLDLAASGTRLRDTIRRLDEAGIRVSLFVDPDPATLDAAKDLGVPAVELHTGRYANTWRRGDAALEELRRAARHAADMGLFVHAGHGLTYLNVGPVAAIPEIEELNIGHSVVSRAVMVGMRSAVQEMARLVKGARL
jgi:pyridoxine 5-phosphate synthase